MSDLNRNEGDSYSAFPVPYENLGIPEWSHEPNYFKFERRKALTWLVPALNHPLLFRRSTMDLRNRLCPWDDSFVHMLAVRPSTLPRL